MADVYFRCDHCASSRLRLAQAREHWEDNWDDKKKEWHNYVVSSCVVKPTSNPGMALGEFFLILPFHSRL